MLPRLILTLVVVLSPVLAKAAQPPIGCGRPGAVLLSSPKLKAALLKSEPITVPGTVDGLHIKGTLVFAVAVDISGEVTCIKSVSGHPVMISAAMESIRKWKFHPYFAREKKREFCGRIAIKYEAIGRGVTYEVI